MIDLKQIGEWRKLCNTRSSMSFIEAVDVALPQLLDEVERLNAILNHKIEGYTIRYSVSATGTFDGASAEGKTVEEAVRKLGETLEGMKGKQNKTSQ